MTLARVLAFQFRNRASGFLGGVSNVSIRLEPRVLVKTCAALATTKALDDAASRLQGVCPRTWVFGLVNDLV
jgi:hypothetical protein